MRLTPSPGALVVGSTLPRRHLAETDAADRHRR